MSALVLICSTISADEIPVDFNSEIRPILTQYCTACHGGVKQAGDLSFVYPDQVLPPDGYVIEPGDASASILIERIKSDDPAERMPPPDEHPEPLPAEKIALLERWIDEGARWGTLWAMGPIVPRHGEPTAESRPQGTTNPIDELVARRWADQGLTGTDPASPREWLRRVSFDLIGLPPSLEQTDEFVTACEDANSAETRHDLYAAKVDELLASPHFGERWASLWMDLARYADSKGFEKDPHRDMWPYRDWLIRAFNDDMPYDDFTIKQLAGDLLPNPTADDLIATAFHRNTQTNTEGGTDDEEFRVAATIDRVNTTWTVWQATTFGCVQCHAHPYDPFQHEDYYASMALFNNSVDADLDNDYPTLKIPVDEAQRESAVAVQRAFQTQRHLRNQLGAEVAEQVSWQAIKPVEIESSNGRLKIVGDAVKVDGGTFPVGVTYTLESDAAAMTALRIEILPEAEPFLVPEQGAVLSQLTAHWVDENNNATPLEIADVFADAVSGEDAPRDSLSGSSKGVGEYPKLHKPRTAYFVFKSRVSPPENSRLRLTMIQKAATTGNVATPLRHFRWSVTDDEQLPELLESTRLKEATSKLAEVQAQAQKIKGAALPVFMSRPAEVARSTYMFIRGNWLEPGEEVPAGIPDVFASGEHPAQIDDRLDFARWLVSPDNPLAARVWANRIWEQLFGRGLCETLEDFGSSGLQPTHPELIDYLAYRLRDDYQWHLKPFLKEVVLSSTYRRTHNATPEAQSQDPLNVWLARGPRTRLTAEMVRDQALLASGVLSDQIGGPSVMPPQPDGVWQTVYSGAQWKTAAGADRYRRGIYTYWRRTSPYPSFLLFDSPTRDLCSARRLATNTPLQALVTLNDPVYVEAGTALAQQAISETGSADAGAVIAWMFAAVTQQNPTSFEAAELLSLYEDLRVNESNASAEQAPGEQGSLDQVPLDQAALAIVANTILNLDKALTK